MQRAKTQSRAAQLKHKIHLSPEAQRISSVVENCISQLRIAAALPAVLQSDALSNVVDKELSGLLKRHRVFVENPETLEGAEHESQTEIEEEAGEAKKSNRTRLDKGIKNSVRDALRHFRTHPEAASGLKSEISMEIGESEEILVRNLKIFHSHVLEKLQASQDEEPQLPTLSSLTNDLRQIISMEEKLHAATAPSEQGNDDTQEQRQAHLKTHRSKQTGMQQETDQLNVQSDDPLLENKQPSEQGNDVEGDATSPLTGTQEQQPQLKTLSTKQTSMQQEIDQLNVQLYNLILENRQAERALQEKNEQVEAEIEYLLKNFDNEIEETQANLESNEQAYEREQEEVTKLENLCAVLEEEYNQIQERHRLAEEKRQEEMKELELKTKAAIYAQAWWRGYSTRKALKNKGKSKKAKKGKGKKTK